MSDAYISYTSFGPIIVFHKLKPKLFGYEKVIPTIAICFSFASIM